MTEPGASALDRLRSLAETFSVAVVPVGERGPELLTVSAEGLVILADREADTALGRLNLLAAGQWDEKKHPRDHGKFSGKQGGKPDGGGKDPNADYWGKAGRPSYATGHDWKSPENERQFWDAVYKESGGRDKFENGLEQRASTAEKAGKRAARVVVTALGVSLVIDVVASRAGQVAARSVQQTARAKAETRAAQQRGERGVHGERIRKAGKSKAPGKAKVVARKTGAVRKVAALTADADPQGPAMERLQRFAARLTEEAS